MFILIAVIASVLVSAIQIFALKKPDTPHRRFFMLIESAFLTPLFSIALWKYMLQNKHFLVLDGYTSVDYVKFFILSVIVGILILLIQIAIEKLSIRNTSKASLLQKIVSVILVFLGTLLFFLTLWGKSEYGDLPADQILINYLLPTTGAGTSDFISAYEGPLFISILLTTVFAVVLYSNFNGLFQKKHDSEKKMNHPILCQWSFLLAIVIFVGGLSYGVYRYQLIDIAKAYLTKSTFIDDHYVDPRNANLQFPEKKRNLIHIYLESMENSYMSKDLGGFMDENLIPELTKLATEGYTFSHNSNRFGGPQAAVGTTWSVASMVNMSTGLPMKAPTERNAYGSKGNFLPGACTLGDILAEQGYEQTLMFGADADFGGLTYYFESHGDFNIMDYKYAQNNGMIPKDYFVWWGYEDDKLFDFAKEELTRLSQTGKPFNFTMETADTHRPDGYLSPKAPTPYENQYANVVAYSSSEVYKFVRWIQAQPFYENTTVVITGDHLSMETNFFQFYEFDDDYRRTQYNVILNPVDSVKTTDESILLNRDYANFDMFPTILSSMGVSMDGSRLGIGTDLFSGDKTIFEEYGFEEVNEELEKMSLFYNTHILK